MAEVTTYNPIEPSRHVERVQYCGICSLVPELCSYTKGAAECKAWLKDALPDLFSKLYVSDPSEEPPKEPAPKQPLTKKQKQKAQQPIVIKRIERTRRKRTISICGLAAYNVDLKALAKQFSSKFACGAAVTQNASGQDEIVVQGDLQDEIYEFLIDKFPQVTHV
jgi:translation initiation factor 1 (eIF-1/SUI1)